MVPHVGRGHTNLAEQERFLLGVEPWEWGNQALCRPRETPDGHTGTGRVLLDPIHGVGSSIADSRYADLHAVPATDRMVSGSRKRSDLASTSSTLNSD